MFRLENAPKPILLRHSMELYTKAAIF